MEQHDEGARLAEGDGRAPGIGESSPPPGTPPEARDLLGEQTRLMEEYVAQLCDTGVTHGLVGPREVPRMWERHVLNCAVVAPGITAGAEVADIGAGAGLPGLVLAIARPDLRMTLVEPLLRRTVWLERTVESLGLDNVEVVRARADELWGQRSFAVVTSRAVARIGELARWSLPLVRHGGEMFVIKGSSARTERDEDEEILRRLRVRSADVETWGAGIVDPETVTLRLAVDGVAPRLTRKQAGTGPSKAKQKADRRRSR